MNKDDEEKYSIKEAAVLSGKKERAIRRDCQFLTKEIGAYKIGRDWFMPAAGVEFLKKLKRGPLPKKG